MKTVRWDDCESDADRMRWAMDRLTAEMTGRRNVVMDRIDRHGRGERHERLAAQWETKTHTLDLALSLLTGWLDGEMETVECMECGDGFDSPQGDWAVLEDVGAMKEVRWREDAEEEMSGMLCTSCFVKWEQEASPELHGWEATPR